MSRDRLDPGARAAEIRSEQQAQSIWMAQFRKDFRDLMAEPGNRRVLQAFLDVTNIDGTTFSPNAMTQSHAIGKQDAGRWWINCIRDHCPQLEARMREEANQAALVLHNEESEDDN